MDKDFWNMFWDKLKDLYAAGGIDQKVYSTEKPLLWNVLQNLEESENFRGVYEFDEPIGIGSAGKVLAITLSHGIYRS